MRDLVHKEPLIAAGDGVTENLRLAWERIRCPIIVPLLQIAVYLCASMSLMLFLERMYMAIIIFFVKLLRRKRYTKYKLDAMKQELEANNNHPKRVSAWKKIHVLYAFFFVRKIVAHFVTFFFYCVVIPTCVLVPEVRLPIYIAVYVPATITLLNAICTPRSAHLILFWILFENVMSVHRAKATIIGLLEANRVNEWIVTEKLGNALKQKSTRTTKKPRSRIGERIHLMELFMGLYLTYCAIYNLMFQQNSFYIYLLFQAVAFFIMGFGYVGTFVPN